MASPSLAPLRWPAFHRFGLLSVICLSLVQAQKAGQEERKLVEIQASDEEDLNQFMQDYMEPSGVVCVAHVKEGSANHKLMQKLAAVGKEDDSQLYNLFVPMAAVLGSSDSDESLVIKYRKAFASVWTSADMTPLDGQDAVFPFRTRGLWGKKKVRRWLLDNGFPTINIRVTGQKGDREFPGVRYLGDSNEGGLAVIVANLTGDLLWSRQFQISKMLRPHAERLRKKNIRFTFLEKTKKTREWRDFLRFGLDEEQEAELYLIENIDHWPKETEKFNKYHGSPNKYRLQNVTAENVDAFFADYALGKLPTFWATSEEWAVQSKPPPKSNTLRLSSLSFEDQTFGGPNKKGVLVAFFNDLPADNCAPCSEGRRVWEEVGKKVLQKAELAKQVTIASIDQSANEHPENLVAGKLGQPIVVYYPPVPANSDDVAKRLRRKRKRRILTILSEGMKGTDAASTIVEKILDMLMDEEEEEDEL